MKKPVFTAHAKERFIERCGSSEQFERLVQELPKVGPGLFNIIIGNIVVIVHNYIVKTIITKTMLRKRYGNRKFHHNKKRERFEYED